MHAPSLIYFECFSSSLYQLFERGGVQLDSSCYFLLDTAHIGTLPLFLFLAFLYET